MNNLRNANGGRFKVSPATEHPFRQARAGACADCGMNRDGRGHVLARRRAAGKTEAEIRDAGAFGPTGTK